MVKSSRRKRNERCELPFNISNSPEFKTIVNLLTYVGEGKFATCGHVAGLALQQGCPEPCMLQFPLIYTGRQSWDDLCADLNKSAEKQGFQFTVCKTANSTQAVWTLSCNHNRMFDDKACKRNYENGDAQFVGCLKVIKGSYCFFLNTY
jgi:hypothetical protein